MTDDPTSILFAALTDIAASYPKTDEGAVLAEIARDALAKYKAATDPSPYQALPG